MVWVQGDVTGRQRTQVRLVNVLNLSNKVFWLVVKETIDLCLQLICSREGERERNESEKHQTAGTLDHWNTSDHPPSKLIPVIIIRY